MNTRALTLCFILVAAAAGAGCGSSSTISTAPGSLPRCAVAVGTAEVSVPASGGTGIVAITTARECAWTASSTAAWLSIRGTSSGQGDGQVEFVAAANSEPATRRGAIELNDQRANVTQAAADCTMELGNTSASFSPAGGSGTIGVTASSPACAWTAVADSSWIVIRSGATGTGSGTVTYDVGAASGPPRTGTVLVAGQRFSVTQSETCAYAVSPLTYAPGPGGGSTTVTVSTAPGCPWTAASNVSWASVVQGASGTGSGTVQIAVQATSGATRTGSVLVAGHSVNLTQSGGCSFAIAPQSQQVDGAGGDVSVTVTTDAGCAWTAASGESWLTVAAGSSGSGNGIVRLTVAATTGGPRAGTATIAGQTFTVNQGSGCAVSIAPTSTSVPAAGGTGSVAVTAPAGCAFTATSNASWLTITSGASGTGNGTVQFSAASTNGGPRSGALTIGGQTFTVNQGSGCTLSILPPAASPPSGGGTGSVSVTAGAGCDWTAVSTVPWLTVTSGASGSGNGTVQYTVAANSGGPRSGALTIGGQTFTVNQAGACSVSISPPSGSVPVAGGNGSVTVAAAAGCAWTASSGASWLTVTSGSSGSGNGTVNYTASANPGAARSAVLTIAGQTFTVSQPSGCSYGATPATVPIPAAGGTRSATVTAAAGCAWTAVSGVSWITVTNGAGTGTGSLEFVVAVNSGAARSGTITVAGQTITVNQSAAACTYSLNPTSRSTNRNGNSGPGNFNVVARDGCMWTATSDVAWITVTSGSPGNGDGTVNYAVAVNNTNQDRSGTITVAGLKFTVNQSQ